MTSQGRATLRFCLPPFSTPTTRVSRENIAYASIERDSVAYLHDDNLSIVHPLLYLKLPTYTILTANSSFIRSQQYRFPFVFERPLVFSPFAF